MKRLLLFALLAVSPAYAQEKGIYNRALSAFNSGDYAEAVQLFFEVNSNTADPDLRLKSEYYLAASFQKTKMPMSALVYFSSILGAGKMHPFYVKAVEGLVNVQETLNDHYLIPTKFEKSYDVDAWATVAPEALYRANYLVATVMNRDGALEDAREFALGVPQESTVYLKAQYLLGVLYADPRYPGGDGRFAESIRAFENVVNSKLTNQKDAKLTQQLAFLGLGRVYYGLGRYDKAVEAYEKVPRFSKYWDQALFENGFARFQNDDLGGGLGSLQALHAPQFAGAFQPESWILKSTIYYFSCLYDESKSALEAFDRVYQPMAEKLKQLLEAKGGADRDEAQYFKLVDVEHSEQVPQAVLNYVRSDERMLGLFGMLRQIDVEKKRLEENAGWRSRLSGEVMGYLDSNRVNVQQLAGKLAKARLAAAYRSIKGFSDTGEIIRFETSKAEKELAEAGIDRRALLKRGSIYRPQMPAENWNYWKFQGEFWRDEIGYYQYTLKNGCTAAVR